MSEKYTRKFDIEVAPPTSISQIKNAKSSIYANGIGNYFAEQNFLWNDLPGTLIEILELSSKVFENNGITIKSQEQATESTIKALSRAGELNKYSALHFACHGYFDNNIAEMSSIVLSEVSKHP